MTSEPFLPWHSDFGRTVLTDVPIETNSDDHRFLLRSAIVYETDQGTMMVLRVEAIHPPPPQRERPQTAATGPPKVIIHTPDLSPDEVKALRDARERMTVTVDGLSTRRGSFSDDGFHAEADYWVVPAPEGEFKVNVSYGDASAETVVRP